MSRKEAIDFIAARILAGTVGRDGLESLKREASRRFGAMVTNPELLAALPDEPRIRELLRKKPAKTLSGVTPVAVMIRPQGSCRWGCVFCPFTGLAAKSYTGFEPAALRGRQAGFDPFMQAAGRVRQFEGGGHATDKCEVIVMGGTFLETEEGYRRSFIKGVYEGLNGFRSPTMEEAIRSNEDSAHRVVGLTIETRPDVCAGFIGEMLSYGATRVELGVQNPDDGIYRAINRGHTVRDVLDSTAALKDSAFKVLYHLMPGLPGSGKAKDVGAVMRIFSEDGYKPDMLKIYPTLVVGGTILERWAREGKYEPYSSEEAADVISEFYRHIPKYVRVMRIQRDIPADRIEGGVRKSNLRELVEERIREKGIAPNEIRYREVGFAEKGGEAGSLRDFALERLDYGASGGKESFISYENADGLIAGFIRLRFPGPNARSGFTPGSALVRELHVYGPEAPIDGPGRVQHKGLGTRLLAEAEDIAREAGMDKMVIISGVGARAYYRRRGYSREGPYMSRSLS
jgi:elongator complex protein 3